MTALEFAPAWSALVMGDEEGMHPCGAWYRFWLVVFLVTSLQFNFAVLQSLADVAKCLEGFRFPSALQLLVTRVKCTGSVLVSI